MLTMSKNTNCFKVHPDVEPGPCVYCSKHDISKRYIHLQQRVSDAPEFYKFESQCLVDILSRDLHFLIMILY